MNRSLALLLILGLSAAACTTSDSSPTDLDAADTCLAGAPDCEDTIADDLPATEPDRGGLGR